MTAYNAAVRICDACRDRACGSCTEADCECFRIFSAWRDYHVALARPRSRRKAQLPDAHAYTGRHERYLNYKLDSRGRRRKADAFLPH